MFAHRSCVPEDCSGHKTHPLQGPAPVASVFPAGVGLYSFWKLGFRQSGFHQYHADPPAHRP